MGFSAEIEAAQINLLRKRQTVKRPPTRTQSGWLTPLSRLQVVTKADDEATANPTPETSSSKTFTLLPDLAAALLRHEKERIGRIWFLLRNLDQQGSGKIAIATVRQALCEKSAEYRVVGWRQMRNLLAAGQGTFWVRDKSDLWLKSQSKVALALGVTRFNKDAVQFEIDQLLQPIGRWRATLYASLHAGESSPISRATLQDMTGVCPESQRKYERQQAIRPKPQFAIYYDTTSEAQWQHGHAATQIIDQRGLHGRAGQTVLLRQLPNSYQSDRAPIKTGLKRRLNRNLADLQQLGDVGNSWQKHQRRYRVGNSRQGSYYQSGKANVWYHAGQAVETTSAATAPI